MSNALTISIAVTVFVCPSYRSKISFTICQLTFAIDVLISGLIVRLRSRFPS
jgi:hypothetical protein